MSEAKLEAMNLSVDMFLLNLFLDDEGKKQMNDTPTQPQMCLIGF